MPIAEPEPEPEPFRRWVSNIFTFPKRFEKIEDLNWFDNSFIIIDSESAFQPSFPGART